MAESSKQILGPNKVDGYEQWLSITKGQLNTFLDALTPVQLAQPVKVWGDEHYCVITGTDSIGLLGHTGGSSKDVITYAQLKELMRENLPGYPERQVYITVTEEDMPGKVKEMELLYIEELQENYRYDGDEACCPESILKSTSEGGYDEDEFYIVHPARSLMMYAEE